MVLPKPAPPCVTTVSALGDVLFTRSRAATSFLYPTRFWGQCLAFVGCISHSSHLRGHMDIEVTDEAVTILKRSFELAGIDPAAGGVRLRVARGLGGGSS